ncbi:hypothetical protein V1527DRAFT_516196 [Lipomyces starkeyi]
MSLSHPDFCMADDPGTPTLGADLLSATDCAAHYYVVVTRSPTYHEITLKADAFFLINSRAEGLQCPKAGRNILRYIHVNDLADMYDRLLIDAVKGPASSDARLWGAHAYYFTSGEELTFAEYMEALVKVLKGKGVLSTDTIKHIGTESNASGLEICQ